ncbi:Hypothetical predicted protein [Mytilus galloprovincialis]|uniref:Uncharacterized protein n=1 Tax=Mytilus galloprovincialis TaxID=29158 RepID=A0A8B6HK63_MYTGA|nr:Hypothetical predicted protein [Mytilus galloprovincialis]
MEKLNDGLAVCETFRDKLGNANLQSDLQPSLYNILLKNCNEIISLVDIYSLPQMKTVITELTDAGPGVGFSNLEVRFRMTEIARIHSSDRRLRIHRERNEVERTNSAIDALVDGATLTWQRFKAFDGMTEEEIKDMTIEDIKMHKEMIMEKNVWSVAEEVKLRVDDQKAQKFFQDRECLMNYYDVSKANQKKVPGHLGKHKRERDKIKIVTHHIGKTIFSETACEDEENDGELDSNGNSNGDTNEENDEVDSDGDTSSDEGNDSILEKLDTSEISEESDPDEYVTVVPDVKTRGRRISMPLRFRDYIYYFYNILQKHIDSCPR